MLLLAVLAACQAPAAWSADAADGLQRARAARRDVVVYFALPGRDVSDRMERDTLPAPGVLAALQRGGFESLRVDGFARQSLYDLWIGSGEGMGVCVLDGEGQVYAARPGPQDPPELAAWLDLVAAQRGAVAAARAQLAAAPNDRDASFRLGCLLLDLGCRQGTEALLLTAAQQGVVAAYERLARLHALSGNLTRARQWLQPAGPSAAAAVTEGYLLFKERRHLEAVAVLDAAVRRGDLGVDRQRAQLFLGKALHEAGRDQDALPVLQALIAERTGSTFEAAALHTLGHIQQPDHGHSHD